MICKKCKQEISDNSLYCNFCGKKQTVTSKTRHRKRAYKTGTIRKDSRYKNQYIALAPATPNGAGRQYIGCYPDMKTAQAALEDYIKNGRPELYNATFADIYKLWSEIHYKRIKDPTVWKAMYKRMEKLHSVKMADLRTVHFQQFVNEATSKSSATKLKSLALMLCRFAMENDVVDKNYAEFIKLPKFEKTEKIIFTNEQIKVLWQHSDDKRIQVILAMIYMGFRPGEMLALKAENIHFDEGYIIGGIKTEAGTNRIIPFPTNIPDIAGFFREWLKECQNELFPIDEKQFRHYYFYQPLYELGMINGHRRDNSGNSWIFPDKYHLTPHSCRHTFASLSASAGMKPENLQKIIGHADYSTTADIYIHKNIEELIDEMSKLKK